jgi:hypothetical protein
MYDVYRHVARPELRLIIPRGVQLPNQVPKNRWRLAARQLSVPQIVATEIRRSGFSIIRPQTQLRSPDAGFGQGQ